LYLIHFQVTKLFAERLQAWKHAVAYLEDYVTATEKTNHAHGKEYERVLKVGGINAIEMWLLTWKRRSRIP
jgi:truncated hemoglobin YjbI